MGIALKQSQIIMIGGAVPSSRPKPDSLYGRFKAAAKALKQECLALYYAIHDPRTPLVAKVLPWMVSTYDAPEHMVTCSATFTQSGQAHSQCLPFTFRCLRMRYHPWT